MKELCVVHLVRAQNGIEPFRRFLESYRENPGGFEHDLLIVFKGFYRPQDTAEYRELLAPLRYATMEISDEGFDITAYFYVVKCYSEQYRYFCFLNSYSVILDSNWLKKLHQNISKPDVGLVGATGSWLSNKTHAKLWFKKMAVILGDRFKQRSRATTGIATEVTTEVATEPTRGTGEYLKKTQAYWKIAIAMIEGAWISLIHVRFFDPYPNYHIRTNAFIISGELMKKLKCPTMKKKMDAYRFESGKKGLTKQILNMKKRVIVVGKNGRGYEKEEWNKSRTFWISDQENLLVADNQTRDYQDGTEDRRSYLASMAWGEANE